MVSYDRTNLDGVMIIGGSEKNTSGADFKLQIILSIVIITVLFLLLVYLIFLRRNRIKAEEWLETHKDLLFGNNWGKMTEVEILEALVKSKNMSDTLASPQAQQDVAAAARNIPDNAWVSDANSDGENEGKDKQLLSGDYKK